jgi:hypothetical protein
MMSLGLLGLQFPKVSLKVTSLIGLNSHSVLPYIQLLFKDLTPTQTGRETKTENERGVSMTSVNSVNSVKYNVAPSLKLRKYRSVDFKVCNICGFNFIKSSIFDRYCESCRARSDLYRYAEWAGY